MDYRSEVGVILVNLSDKDFTIEPGERIGQFVLQQVIQIVWEEVDTLTETERKGGYGSTGTF